MSRTWKTDPYRVQKKKAGHKWFYFSCGCDWCHANNKGARLDKKGKQLEKEYRNDAT